MSEYLTKEEIKQWRSSLEKITLEEYAARLGKKIEESKPTNDLVDIVMKNQSYSVHDDIQVIHHTEKITSISEHTLEREKEIVSVDTPVESLKTSKTSANVNNKDEKKKVDEKVSNTNKKEKEDKIVKETKDVKEVKKDTKEVKKTAKAVSEKSVQKTADKPKKQSKKTESVIKEETTSVSSLNDEDVKIVFNKALTDREQLVFDYFLKNKNQIVFAKDLAKLLDLPRDYVYKYIKNLRAKIDGDKLKNASTGGFMLSL